MTPCTVAHQAPLFMGILQARILEWVAMPFSRGFSQLVSLNFLSHSHLPLPHSCIFALSFPSTGTVCLSILICEIIPILASYCAVLCLVVQSCPTLHDQTVACQASQSMGILQARILEWVAMLSSRGSSRPRDQTQVSRIASGYFFLLSEP